MNITQIENNLQTILDNFNQETFIYDFLLAYGLPKASITRLKKGNLNMASHESEISWKKKLYFKEEFEKDLHELITELKEDIKHKERFIIVTDYKVFLAHDTKTDENLDIEFKNLIKHFNFFLPWAGMEKAQHQNENPADVKAAEKMAKLFDEIKRDNPSEDPEFVHDLNVFLTRLLFCYFAEDTNIFTDNQFTNILDSHTQIDGSDLDTFLAKFFNVLNCDNSKRSDFPAYLKEFPFVNGGLFKKEIKLPKFTRRSRKAIIDNGELQWKEINPDIFGSMIQAVITPEKRGGLGMHYTSVPNIMKVIKPLFLDELYEEFNKALNKSNDVQKKHALSLLHNRICNMKTFDPACGSGNFLIIAYKELRKLEMEIFKAAEMLALSGISLSQFFGIEIDDFAHEVAILSLWLAEHQMNVSFLKEFGRTNPTLPLKAAGKIVCANACRVDWEEVCPKSKDDEIYILGNPPYLGQRNQTKNQRDDLDYVFNDLKNYKNLDYISCWFLKASKYIIGFQNLKYAFVSTNSICQGTQVEMLWTKIFNLDLEIIFAFRNIKWTNNAKGNAGITVSIIAVGSKSNNYKFMFSHNRKQLVQNINPYLINSSNIVVGKRRKPLSNLPKMDGGNQPREGGYLILSDKEKVDFVKENNEANKYLRPLIGSNEFLKSINRWCIWVKNNEYEIALNIPELKKRFNQVYELRRKGNTLEKNFINYPYRFVQNKEAKKNQIIIPVVSSENRNYIPIGFLDKSFIVLNSANVIFEPDIFVFGVISSKIHNLWVKVLAGRMRTDIRYTSGICFNSFPFPPISDKQKEEITQGVFRILEEREKHSEKTLAQLYDPDKMPEGLREAHHQNDLAIERCYRSKPFNSDEERLEYLFKLYEKMIAEEKEKLELEKSTKIRKKRS